MSMSDERITLPETRDAHRRLITIAAAVLAQRTWGEPVARIQSGEMDDALALLAGQLREVADSLAAVERAARADEREACARLCDGIAAGAKQMDGLDGDYESGVEAGAEQCASALRARDAGDGEGGR